MSTRYATVLILLTVKREFCYKFVLMFYRVPDVDGNFTFTYFFFYFLVSENVEMLSKLTPRLLAVTARG